MTATGNEPVKLSQLKTALEGIGSGGSMRIVKATMSDGVITPPDGVDVSGAKYVFIAPGMYNGNEQDAYPFTTLLEIQEVNSLGDAKRQPFPNITSSKNINISYVSLVLMNGIYTIYSFTISATKLNVKCTPYFILTQ